MMDIWQFGAIGILISFYGCYFGKMIAQRSRGIRTDRMGRGKTGFPRAVELGTKLSAYIVPVVMVPCVLSNVTALPAWARFSGFVLGAAGIVMFIAAVVTMRDSWRAGVQREEKTELITSGIYSVSRNPAFLGFDMVYAGVTMMFFSWPLLAVCAVAALMLHLQIVNVEEDFLIEVFGQAYLDYRRRVCRYLGRRRG